MKVSLKINSKFFVKISLYMLFLNYYFFVILFGRMIPYINYFPYIFIIIYMFERKRIRFPGEIWAWIIYLGLSFIVSPFAVSTNYAISALVLYVRRLLIIIGVYLVADEEKSIKFPISLLSVMALLSSYAVLTHSASLRSRLELTTGASVSANDMGSIVAYGCATVIIFFNFYFEKREILSKWATIGGTLVLVMTMFLAGSRKALYAVVILYAILLLTGSLKMKSAASFFGVAAGLAAVLVIYNTFLSESMQGTSLYIRIWGENAIEAAVSDTGRMDLYILALKDFINHPFWGLGFNNFAYIHGNYTHSTYVEPLACSGILGLVYLYPYGRILFRQVFLMKAFREREEQQLLQKRLFAFYIMFLFIGIGIPYIYKDVPCIILGMFIAHQELSYNTLQELHIDPGMSLSEKIRKRIYW